MEEKVLELKSLLSQVNHKELLGELTSSLVKEASSGNDIRNIIGNIGIGSVKKVYKYLVGLVMSTKSPENPVYTKDIIDHIKNLLSDIIKEYLKSLFDPNKIKTEEESAKLEISMDSFLSYFDFDILAYREQILECIKNFYAPFSEKLETLCGLNLDDFLLFEEMAYNSLDINKSIKGIYNIMNKFQDIGEITEEDKKSYCDLIDFYTIKFDKLEEVFGYDKAQKILQLFSLKREERDYLYYTDENPFEKNPLCEVDENVYMVAFPDVVTFSIYYKIEEILASQESKYATRDKNRKDKLVEKYFVKTMEELFNNKCIIYAPIYEEKGNHEHDLLIETDEYIFVCEIKASKVKVGTKTINIEKTYEIIKNHFNSKSGIGKGYEQALKLKNKFEENSEIILYDVDNKEIKFQNYSDKKIIPVVLTLGQFGMIGINGTTLLKKDNEQIKLWVCNLFDLENIIKINKYYNIKEDKIFSYIEFRSENYERILAGDELDIYSSYITKDLSNIPPKQILCFLPNPEGDLIDKIYFEEKGCSEDFYKINILKEPIKKKTKIGRNSPCPCGSGKKYKKCCGKI